MERIPVSSSNVASIGYDADTQTLEVEFNSNTIYQYYGVPAHVYEELMNAGSKGQYLNSNIKKAYPYSKVG
jgi:hypothetical protein